jgi:hypothetical protein
VDPKHEEPPNSLPIIIITRGTTGKSIIAGSLCFLFYPRVTTKHRTRTDIQKKVIPQVLTVIYMLIPGWFCHTRRKDSKKLVIFKIYGCAVFSINENLVFLIDIIYMAT